MPEDREAPSRRQRLLARGKLALALIAPIVALIALYFIAHTSGAADGDRVANVQTPTTVQTIAPTRTPEPRFTNPLLGLLPDPSAACPTITPAPTSIPTPTPDTCLTHLEITFTNHWLS